MTLAVGSRFRATPMLSWLRHGLAFLALATSIALAGSSGGEAAGEPKRVLMLHSFGLRFKPWTDNARVIRSEISRNMGGAVGFHDHSLLEARTSNADSEGPFVDYLAALYASKVPDLIIAIGAPAATFVQRYRSRLFPGVPMLLTAVAQRRVEMDKLTENDTVVGVDNDHRAALENILHVLPRTKVIKVVSGVSPNDTWWRNELKRDFASLAKRVEIVWYNELSFEQILNDAAHLGPHTAIYWHLMTVDAAGVAHEESSAINRLAAVANAPMFTHSDAFFGEGVVGGPMQIVEQGVSAAGAAVAVRILNGERAGDIKTPPVTFASPKFDWRQMQRWSIRESDLPSGSTVWFKPPSVWETYRWQLVTILAALLFQGAVILLLVERHRRQAAELVSQQRMVELAHVNRLSTGGEMAASIAHEINQPLGAILNNVETAEIILKSRSPDLHEMSAIVADIRRDNTRATEVIRHLRSYVKKVPSQQSRFDLNDEVAEAVRFLTPEARSRGVVLRIKRASVPLPVSGHSIQLEQVLSNLILNAMDAMSEVRQAQNVVTVETALDRDYAEVSVADTGPGIAAELAGKLFEPFYSTKEHGMGMGLSIVRTIVEAHGGEIRAENSYHGGAVFRVRLPLA